MRLALPLLMLLPALASAQIEPVQLYNGIRRPFFVKVRAPGGDAKVEIQALTPVTAVPLYSAVVEAGKIDVAKALPDLWTTKHPRLLYLQLLVDGKKRGPALVLQPMTVPDNSRLAADGKTVEFVPDEDQEFAGYRAYVDQHLVFETSMGRMEFRLRPDCAPNTAFNIMEFARNGLYTETIWHRVVAKRKDGTPFVIQGGDPAGTGSGGPGFAYPLEKSPLPHDFGVISIARSTDPNTNGCQVFVCLSREGTKHLDGRYASFGQILSGGEVVKKIAAVPVGKDDRPNDPPVIHRVRLINAGPYEPIAG
jgi:peptidyl-prolyl cis-trans isomerase B (cyclophilin B)